MLKAVVTTCCILILVSITTVEAGQITWDFENSDQLEDWEIVYADWKIEDGKLVGTIPECPNPCPEIYSIVTGSSDWKDYTFEAEVTIAEGKYCYLNFYGQDEDNFATVELNFLPTIIFYQKIGGGYNNRNPSGGLDDFPLPPEYVETHIWKVDVRGDDITLYMDGEEMASITAIDSSGKIGFGSDTAQSDTGQVVLRIDNVKVEGPDIPGNFIVSAVQPTGKLATTWSQIKMGR